ncbi:MAG: hypothetical protein F6K58_10760 [Symploca sp. SIO2E9]|nr:hypothetical protein [Symploca sp. SIO2E9]
MNEAMSTTVKNVKSSSLLPSALYLALTTNSNAHLLRYTKTNLSPEIKNYIYLGYVAKLAVLYKYLDC